MPATDTGTRLSQAEDSLQRTREALERNRGNPTEQDWRAAAARLEATIAELKRCY